MISRDLRTALQNVTSEESAQWKSRSSRRALRATRRPVGSKMRGAVPRSCSLQLVSSPTRTIRGGLLERGLSPAARHPPSLSAMRGLYGLEFADRLAVADGMRALIHAG